MYVFIKPQRLQERNGRGYTFSKCFPQYSGYMGFSCPVCCQLKHKNSLKCNERSVVMNKINYLRSMKRQKQCLADRHAKII